MLTVCVHCNNRPFVNEDALRQHLKSSSAHPFCAPCNRHFKNEKAYEAHMAARHPPTFDCTKCNRTYRSQSSLEDHYRGSPAHPNCNRCGKGFKNKRSVEEHFAVQHAVVSCSCGPVTLYFDELDVHYLSSEMHPSCQPCNRGFKDDASYNEHLASSHTTTYCAHCGVQLESSEALLDHYLMSPRHPTCMPCAKGFKDDQEFSQHLSSVHAPSTTGSQHTFATGSTSVLRHSSIPIRRPIVRIESPALSLCPDFSSPIMDVTAPTFSPSILPPPGGIVDDIWAMRENTQAPIPRRAPGRISVNSITPVLADPFQRRFEIHPYTRDSSFSSSIRAEPSRLSHQLVPEEQKTDDIQTSMQLQGDENWGLFMCDSDPVVPLQRGTENAYQAIGTGVRDRQSIFETDSQPSISNRSRASSSVRSSSPPSSATFQSLASPRSSISESEARPFIVSSPVLSSVLQASECQKARSAEGTDKDPDLLLSAVATPIVASPEFELPSPVDTSPPSVPKYATFSPASSSSPDVSSPLGLAALPTMSPLATTPIERSRPLEDKDGKDLLKIPEARCTVPASPPGRTSTPLDEVAANDRLAFLLPSDKDENLSVMTIRATTSLGSNSPNRTGDEELGSSPVQECPASGSPLFSHDEGDAQPRQKLGLPDGYSPTGMGSMSSLPTPTTAVDALPNRLESGQLSVSRLLRCRLCQMDMCDDPTATMCGHVFCYRCITESIITVPRCPTCAAPTLLYCLFRLDLSA